MRSFIKTLKRYFHTLRYLKLIQFKYRFLRQFPKKINFKTIKNLPLSSFSDPIWIKSKKETFDGEYFYLLNQKIKFSKDVWSKTFEDVLWSYNCNYLDFINEQTKFDKTKYIFAWIENTSIEQGISFDPYPTSLRVVNLIKWCISNKNYDKKILDSIYFQTIVLNKNIEWHLLANHIISNLKALIFAGYFFDNGQSKKWLIYGKKNLLKQLDEQILKDGAHYELSPMYHNIIISDLLDLVQINKLSKTKNDKGFEVALNRKINSMLNWSSNMTHPDNEIAFFNDSTFSVCPRFDELKDYQNLVSKEHFQEETENISYMSDSGYISLRTDMGKMIIDVGNIGIDYNPGHAHADSLSFELSINSRRFFVNSGTSTYSRTELRNFQRSTRAHNTIEVNDTNSSDVWDIFRVGARAKNINTKLITKDNKIIITSSHNGYKNFIGGNIHQRTWEIEKNKLLIKDKLIGEDASCASRLYLHPSVEVDSINENQIKLVHADGTPILINIPDSKFILKDSYYYCGFGLALSNKCIEIEVKNNSCRLSVIKL